MSRGLAIDPALQLTLRAALSLLFVWAASHKLADRAGFRSTLAEYELLRARWLEAVAVLLMSAEVGVATALWFPTVAAIGALAAGGLLVLYAGAIAINLRRGRRHIDCGCTGAAGRQPLSGWLVARNGLLVCTALAAALPAGGRALTWVDDLTVVAGVAALALLYAAADGLLAAAPTTAALARKWLADVPAEPHPHGHVDHA